MTGSKRSLKERIKLIAKKPKTAAITLIFVLVTVMVTSAWTFTGTENRDSLFHRYPSFSEWVDTLTVEEIQRAYVASNYGVYRINYTLSHNDYEELVHIFKSLDENDFSREKAGSFSIDNCRLALYRQDKRWLFKCLDDGTVGLMFNDAETGRYFDSEGKHLIIFSDELWNYITDLVAEKGSRY